MNNHRPKSKNRPHLSAVMRSLTALTGLFIVSSSYSAADDGGISSGGSPHLLSGHATVRMVSEQVDMTVSPNLIKVVCRFVFHNSGKRCTVRVGFPDQGLGAEEPYQGEPVPTRDILKATFQSYDSYVDGKKVPTILVPTDDRSLYWHTKLVTFKPNSICKIVDVYTLKPGAQVTSENCLYQQTSYILHTGSSWHDTIGKARIVIKLAPSVVQKPIRLFKKMDVCKGDIRELKWSTLPGRGEHAVIYQGPGKAEVIDDRISINLANIKPTQADDIHIFYNHHKLTNL